MPNYWSVVTSCIERTLVREKRVIVRHLLMPGHFECCTAPVLRWLAAHPGLEVSLLTQYLAPAHTRGELAASLTTADIQRAQQLAAELSLHLVR
jgi:putative pyruvate formate lyase activating enzyme